MSDNSEEETVYQRMLEQEEILNIKRDECYLRTLNKHIGPLDVRPGCEALWDGILCWNGTAPDTLVRADCPYYVFGFNDTAKASKYCTADGTWYINPHTNSTWSNYSLCNTETYATLNIDPEHHNTSLLHRWLPVVKVVSQIGYGVSISTLVLAFLVLLLSKRLRCPRNTLHMHLFVSFILRAFMALLKDSLFVQGVGLSSDVVLIEGQLKFLPDKDNWACKVVTSLWQFCIMVNYSWILMEGLYLHNLIFMALFTDSSAITMYVLLGWGLPVMVVLPWVILRALLEDNLCWTTHQIRALYLIIRLPIIASVLVNFSLFLNIVRVLMLKFKASLSVVRRNARYGKWARSTLVLMPLFGVHYSLSLGMEYWLDPTLEMLWIFFDQLFASFQGFLVSLLYCLLNGEVRAELARTWLVLRGKADCGPVPDDAGVSSLLVISRQQQLARSRGASLPEIGGSGRSTRCNIALKALNHADQQQPQLYLNDVQLNL